MVLEYDGTNYFGWQRQKNSKIYPTIQSKIEDALQRIFQKKVKVTASGRTDTGVHALGQCASFKVNTKIPVSNILRAINTYLPGDILVKDIKEVPLSFNARYSAKRKWYRYTIINSNFPSVFNRNYVMYIPYKLNIGLMKQAARIIKGRHNFSVLIPGCGRQGVREVYRLDISNSKGYIYIDVIGDGFLYKMVRRIVGILIDIGRGKIKIEDLKDFITAKKKDVYGQTAPARGLCLMRVI